MSDFFRDENEDLSQRQVVLSPTGRYELLIRVYRTGKGTWSYSRGTVTRVGSGEQVCDIQRNYSHFPNSFVVKDGEEWLITGRHYMKQTLVCLDTGEEHESSIPPEFCWIEARLSPCEQVLVVDGCFWAGPSEYRFLDFSNPRKGWPEIVCEDDLLSWESKQGQAWPEFRDDGTIVHRWTEDFFLPLGKYDNDVTIEDLDANETAYDDPASWRRDDRVVTTLRREGSELVIVDRQGPLK